MSSVVSINRSDRPYKRAQRSARYVAVCSGREGVGKSSITINLAIVLARMGHRVCILDADPGVANIHALLGLESIHSLANVIERECTLGEALVNGPAGIQLLTDGNHLRMIAEREEPQRRFFLNQLSEWEARFDYVFIDTPSLNNESVLPYLECADDLLLLITPEPSSLSDAFSLLNKTVRRNKNKMVHVVVNQSQGSAKAANAFERFSSTVRKYLSTNVLYTGQIGMDETIRNAFTLQHPVALYPSNDPSCERFFQLARTFESQLAPVPKKQGGLAEHIAGLPVEEAANIVDASGAFHAEKKPAVSEPETLPTTESKAAPQRSNVDSELFRHTPMLAQQLIDNGQLDAQAFKGIIEQLEKLGQDRFPGTFTAPPAVIDQETTPEEALDGFQRNLLGTLRDNRDSGRTLDELLSQFVTENQR